MPEPEPQKKKQRLVPDLSDNIEVGGQKLTRVARIPAPADPAPQVASEASPTAPPLSLDDIAKKHLGPEAARVIAENSDLLQALAEDPAAPLQPPVDLASRIELFSESPVLPLEEVDPKKRDGMSMSPLRPTESAPEDFLAGNPAPETIFDLFALFPYLDGVTWWIYVERKTPKNYAGLNSAGILRRIRRPITMTEWQNVYGGGTYKLIVYGPPKRLLNMREDGTFAPRALTEPITVTFPGPPSFECMVDLDEDPMTQGMHELHSRRPATMADAQIENKRMDTTEAREKRQETQLEAERKDKERLLKEKSDAQSDLMTRLLAMQEASAQREIERERNHARELRERDERWEERLNKLTGETKKPDDIDRFVTLHDSLAKNGGSVDALRDQHQREIERLNRAMKEDSDRNDERLKEERARADRRIEEEQTRCQNRIKEIEGRQHQLEIDMRARVDKEVKDAKDEAERRLADQHRSFESRLADGDRNHQRDITALNAQHVMAIETLKSTYDMRLDNAKGEVKRTQSDVERYRLEAENSKDVVGAIAKIKEQAEALGMQEGGNEPPEKETIGESLARMGMNLITQLPTVVENIATMTKGKNEQELQLAREHGRREMVAEAGSMALPPPHRRRQAPQLQEPLRPIASAHREPLVPGHEPFRQRPGTGHPQPLQPVPPGEHPQPEDTLRQEFMARSQQAQGAPPGPPPDQQQMGMPPEAQMHPAQSVPPPSMAPPSMPPTHDEARLRAEDMEILQAEPILLGQYNAQTPPEVVAAEMAKVYRPEQIQMLLQQLGSADRVVEAFRRSSGNPDHPFLRRDGKKYLRAIFAEVAKVAGG